MSRSLVPVLRLPRLSLLGAALDWTLGTRWFRELARVAQVDALRQRRPWQSWGSARSLLPSDL